MCGLSFEVGGETVTFEVSKPLYKQVYDRVKESILAGEIEPGSKIVVTRLAKQYNISRTPLREALRQLQKEGLLVQSNQETRVVSIDANDFEQLCQCRLILEKEIMRLIVPIISDEKIKEAEKLVEKANEAGRSGDYLQFLMLNSKFHDVFVYECPNKRLIQLLEQIRSLLLIYRAGLLRSNEYNEEIIKDHLEILKVIKKRDTEKAVKTIEAHVLNDIKRRGMVFKAEEEGFAQTE